MVPFDPTTVVAAGVDRFTPLGQLRGTWPCTRCGRRFAASESWGVSFHSAGDVQLVAVVCPACADTFTQL